MVRLRRESSFFQQFILSWAIFFSNKKSRYPNWVTFRFSGLRPGVFVCTTKTLWQWKRVFKCKWHCCVVHLQDKVMPSTKALWPGASFQNRSYWECSSLFWICEDTFLTTKAFWPGGHFKTDPTKTVALCFGHFSDELMAKQMNRT
jgi:hypothetical protein